MTPKLTGIWAKAKAARVFKERVIIKRLSRATASSTNMRFSNRQPQILFRVTHLKVKRSYVESLFGIKKGLLLKLFN